jgi:hypothetical protein
MHRDGTQGSQPMDLADDHLVQIDWLNGSTLPSFICPGEKKQILDERSHADGLRLDTFKRSHCICLIPQGQGHFDLRPQRGKRTP